LNRVQAVLFDLDGTFADTAPDLARALNRLRAEQGLAPLTVEAARPHTSSGARGLLKIGFDLSPGQDGYETLKERFLDFYEEGLCIGTRLFDGIAEVLAKIEARDLRWGIVTNKSKRFTEPLMRALKLHDRAACIVCGDTTARVKPYPDSLLHAAALLALAPSACLYVGDDLRDVQAARAAGMGVLAAAWGYLGEGGDPDTWGADAVIAHPLATLKAL
jgi:2-phosphoglycolate phosphatase